MNGETTELPERNLDLLRAVAVLSVLASHMAAAAGLRIAGFGGPDSSGQIGVACFFVHTSLVLMGSLERHSSAHPVRDFYFRRAFRIYPALRRRDLPCAGDAPAKPDAGDARNDARLRAAEREHGAEQPGARPRISRGGRIFLAVLWTLPIEVQMYLTLPACFLVARRNGRLLLGPSSRSASSLARRG